MTLQGHDDSGLKFGVSLPDASYPTPESAERFFAELVERVSVLPGVEKAAAVFGLPMIDFNYVMSVHTLDGLRLESDAPSTQLRVVTPGYFNTMGIPIRMGRDFTDHDRHGSTPVIIVNEAAAKLLWPDSNPLGRSLVVVDAGFGLGRGRAGGEVVGVVGNVRHFGLDAEPPAEIYLVHRQFPQSYMAVVAKTSGDPTVYLVALSTMCLASLLACFTPARRAARIDPLEALRSE